MRQAVELGADIIKADPTDDLDEYRASSRRPAGVPVLVRGGGRVPTRRSCAAPRPCSQQGAAGIVYGRNVIQHADPAA